jgi:hypothetical protein
MEKVSITIELANAILNYLSTKPYQEVAVLITELQKQANEQLQSKVAE